TRLFVGSFRCVSETVLNQLAIHDPKLVRLAVDGVFGERTLEAVMVFQREYHDPVTGVVDLDTWEAIREAYFRIELLYGTPPPLNVLPNGAYTADEGAEGEPILIVQAMFSALTKKVSNFSSCKINGCNDGETHTNIRIVQGLAGLPVNGVLDRATWSFLVQLYQALVTRG
ncbi:MAG: peptidoglycan-binding protein, partial [Oscillospiraceae bacterium]|nr:peptidoglycan-binding protein [Oscillospiraceae bacterium]